jgi:hypothetical protein
VRTCCASTASMSFAELRRSARACHSRVHEYDIERCRGCVHVVVQRVVDTTRSACTSFVVSCCTLIQLHTTAAQNGDFRTPAYGVFFGIFEFLCSARIPQSAHDLRTRIP